MRKILFPLLVILSMVSALSAQINDPTEGSLFASDKQGALGFCPLKSTKVRADISGFVARVTVMQEFENTFSDPIEAVYMFPLSQNSAVDDMTMRIGDRVIRGKIMRREEARKTYEAAKQAGQAAALLDQQRPNVFTQSVANIMPGEKVVVEISYVETMRYEDGSYEFVFPMVVGPRYNPASMAPAEAKAVSAPIAKDRAGHDISIEVNLNAGVPIEEVRSISHEIESTPLGAESRKISLKNETTIPNKDFILRYDVSGKKIEDAVLTHRSAKGGFFTMMLQPPDSFAAKDVTPKEIVFVLDTSGSMSGFPIEKAKEAMKLALEGLNPQDTFNLITFAGDTAVLFNKPVSATAENLAAAQAFLAGRRGSGGTEMMKAIRAALEPSGSQRHMRIVCFMTDGYVGNEQEIIAEIQKYPNARIFSFGIGNSVNRFLLDKMAAEGRGEVEYVSLNDDGSKAARRFHERVRNPLLTDISIDWKGMGAADVYPGRQPDLFSAKPVFLTGRYTKSGTGPITLKGKMAGLDYQRNIQVNFPENEQANDALATIWARNRVDELMSKYYAANEADKKVLENEITHLGLEFRLMTQFTSFVAVEEKVVNQDGKMTRVEVPVEMPEGMMSQFEVDGQAAGYSGSPHGYITQSWVGRRNTSSVQVTNSPANVTALSITVPKVTDSTNARVTVDGTSGQENNYVVNGVADMGPGMLNSILSLIEVHQKQLKSLRADITVTSLDPKSNSTETRDGKAIYLSGIGSGNWTRVDWKNPDENLSIYANIFTFYQPKLKQVFIGKSNDETAKAVQKMLNLAKENIKSDYKLALIGSEELMPGVQTRHLELKQKSADLNPIEIWVENNGMILQAKFPGQNGKIITLLLTNVEKNVMLTKNDFKIEYPKDTLEVRGPVY